MSSVCATHRILRAMRPYTTPILLTWDLLDMIGGTRFEHAGIKLSSLPNIYILITCNAVLLLSDHHDHSFEVAMSLVGRHAIAQPILTFCNLGQLGKLVAKLGKGHKYTPNIWNLNNCVENKYDHNCVIRTITLLTLAMHCALECQFRKRRHQQHDIDINIKHV